MNPSITKCSHSEVASLYVLKALCALFVVLLHAPLGIATEYGRILAATAVPLFFMITGYFLYSEDPNKVAARALKTAKKAIVLWLICTLVYYPIAPIEGALSETYMLYLKLLIWGMPPAAGHLWYLMALAQGMLVIAALYRLGMGKLFPYLIALWFLGFSVEDYRPIVFGSEPSVLSANFIIKALPCLAAGMWVAQRKMALLQYKSWGIALACGIALLYLDLFWGRSLLPSYIILKPFITTTVIFTAFVTCLQFPSWGHGSKVAYVGQALSGNIYYWHGLPIILFTQVLTQFSSQYEAYGALIVFVMSLGFAYLIVKVQNRLGVCIL
ncbi:acyltransferase [Porphyromonas sp. COT-290 OH860]|uniref:acyltransferase family protein n=1 Tax=Porphyromonas sp. COT-290 OH860 TaxID=1515615 RepID=UPI00052D2FFC|nr:acyltransferase [Porphyromonas sp. COT-290 OH860]KGN84348.1 hypothetical protein HQ41_04965 [Porphyromonas sp. COT-290 OH860]